MTTPQGRTKLPQNLTVRVSPDFADDVAVLTSAVQPDGTKLDRTAAVHEAVRLLADAYRRAWDYDDVPDGTAPDVVSVRYRTAHDGPEPVPIVHGQPVHEIPLVPRTPPEAA